MFLLPKGSPLAENVPISRLHLPDALEKLKNGKLTGCATFEFSAADCGLVYDEGKLISAVVNRDGAEINDQAALQSLVELMLLSSNGMFNVFALPKDIVYALSALMGGAILIDSQEIALIDFKALLDRIKTEQMTATLKIYTPKRAGLIFYRNGVTVGFFHNASTGIETSAGEVQQIAGLPGARVDLRTHNEADGFVLDLAGLVDIQALWNSSRSNIFAAPAQAGSATSQPQPAAASITPADMETTIIELATTHLGRLGKSLAEKEILNIGGASALKDPAKFEELIGALEKGAKLLASANKIKEMKDAIAARTTQF